MKKYVRYFWVYDALKISKIESLKLLKKCFKIFNKILRRLYRKINPRRNIIAIKLQGGLGNQLWQYCAALALRSQYVGEEPEILLDWCQTKSRQFVLNSLITDRKMRKICTRSTLKSYAIYREKKEFQFDYAILALPPFVILEGYFQHYRYFELAKPYLNIQLQPLPQKYQKLRQEYELVALHVRRGDYTNEEQCGIHGIIPIGYYREALVSIYSQIMKPYVLVFSDDLEWVKQYLDPLLVDLEIDYIYPSGKTLEDFFLMVQCQHFIIANSSYSAFAALLGQRENSIIFMPRMWCQSFNVESKQLFPPDWQTVVSSYFAKRHVNTPKVSIIIPVYNTRKYLLRCLESVCNQTEENIEIIIVDDASPDASWELIQEYTAKDARIVAIQHEQNKHIGGARNTGIKAAKSEWLLFLDSDDYIRLDTVEIFLEKVSKYPEVELFICRIMAVKNGRLYPMNNDVPSEDTILEDPFTAYCSSGLIKPCAWAKLWKRNLFTEDSIYFPEHMTIEDSPTTLRLLHGLSKVLFLPDKLYYYNQRTNSLTHLYSDQSMRDYGKAFDLVLEWGEKTLDSPQFSLVIKFCLKLLQYSVQQYAMIGLDSPYFSVEEMEKEILRRYSLLCTEKYVSLLTAPLIRDNARIKASRWYRFGRLSRKRKIWVIIKIMSRKLKVYRLLHPLAKISKKILAN